MQYQLNWNAFVEEAKQRRKQQNISQSHLAMLVGISTPTLIRFEKGKKNIRLSVVLKILRALGMSESI
jgi:transcriptional regulator with XRE-family HTH domain